MTATMPEEDVEVAVEKAEECRWGRLKRWQPCDLAAAYECLICCPSCRTARLPLRENHVRKLEVMVEVAPGAECSECGTALHLVAVLPL